MSTPAVIVVPRVQRLAIATPGPQGPPGPSGGGGGGGGSGTNGWSPVLASVADGERRVLQVSDWTGGSGTKPTVGQYVGPTGLVSTMGAAVDIRGAVGATGATGATGPQGPAGTTGATGATGPQGAQGIQGPAGPNSIPCTDGTNHRLVVLLIGGRYQLDIEQIV